MRHYLALFIGGLSALSMPLVGSAVPVFAVSESGYLIAFDSSEPDFADSVGLIYGLGLNETVIGIDFRPVDGRLYAVSDGNNLYTLDTSTAAATLVQGLTPDFAGTRFGVDFNPVADRLRITSDARQDLRCNQNAGFPDCAVDGTLAFAAGDANEGGVPNIVGSAYTNSIINPASTMLYGIDSTLNALLLQSPPNDGVLATIGSLGVNTTDLVGFDIYTTPDGMNIAYASLTEDGSFLSRFYTIDLATGLASPVGGDQFTSVIGYPDQVRALAVQVVPAPATVWLLGTAVTGLLCQWRRGRRRRPEGQTSL